MLEVIVDGIIYHQQARGGVSRIYSEILPRICQQDDSVRVTLLTMSDRPSQQPLPQHPHIKPRSVPVVERYLRPWRILGPYAPFVRRLIDPFVIGDGAGQIWHSTYYTSPSRWRGKQVVTIVDMIYERYPDLFNGPFDNQIREQKRRTVAQADAVICISETTRRDVLQFFRAPRDKTWVVPLAHSDLFRPLQSANNGFENSPKRPYLLYVGNRTGYKNFDFLLQAYAVWQHRKEVDLVVISREPWTVKEQRFLSESKLESRVSLRMVVDDEQLRHLYCQAVALVYPSLYEGFGIPLLEAMGCGCPVVASDIPSTREVAGEIPIYFEVASSESLLHALESVMNEGQSTLRRTAGITHASQFSWDKTARQTLEVYRRL